MSKSIPTAFLKVPLANGIGRYICQLQRITFLFCKTNVKCVHMRNFIDNYLVEFADENPGVVVYLKPIRGLSPFIRAEYLTGHVEHKPMHDQTADIILKWVENLRTRTGYPVLPINKTWRTQYPSIQGIWHPELHKPFDYPKTPEKIIENLTELSKCRDEFPISAQEELVNIYTKKKREITLTD